ncbi:MAG: biotin/lipoyl-binding protein [Gammaproteobacteria bacterium]|nr:biotin/lipoyl-binding protein [Gammaproteobacteria bacterium]
MKKLKELLISLLILGVGAGGFVALKASRPRPTTVQVQERAWLVSVQTVHPRPVSPVLLLYGRVESPHLTTLRAALTADVLNVHVREGQWVSRGEILVELDQREAALGLAQREAELAELEAELENELRRYENDQRNLENERTLLELTRREVNRYRNLAARQLDTESRLETARLALEKQQMALAERELAIRSHDSRRGALQARLQRARALRDLAALDLDRTQVRAAFDGRIVDVQVSPGDRVRPGDALTSQFDASALEVRAQIPTRYLDQLRPPSGAGSNGAEYMRPLAATLHVRTRRIEATLQRLSAEVAPGRAGADAFFSLPPRSAQLLELGRTVELQLELPAVQDAVTLPSEALYGSDRIYRLIDDRLDAVTVQRLGEWRTPEGEPRLVVRSDRLASEDRVLITQLPSAVDGLKVRTP